MNLTGVVDPKMIELFRVFFRVNSVLINSVGYLAGTPRTMVHNYEPTFQPLVIVYSVFNPGLDLNNSARRMGPKPRWVKT